MFSLSMFICLFLWCTATLVLFFMLLFDSFSLFFFVFFTNVIVIIGKLGWRAKGEPRNLFLSLGEQTLQVVREHEFLLGILIDVYFGIWLTLLYLLCSCWDQVRVRFKPCYKSLFDLMNPMQWFSLIRVGLGGFAYIKPLGH